MKCVHVDKQTRSMTMKRRSWWGYTLPHLVTLLGIQVLLALRHNSHHILIYLNSVMILFSSIGRY